MSFESFSSKERKNGFQNTLKERNVFERTFVITCDGETDKERVEMDWADPIAFSSGSRFRLEISFEMLVSGNRLFEALK